MDSSCLSIEFANFDRFQGYCCGLITMICDTMSQRYRWTMCGLQFSSKGTTYSCNVLLSSSELDGPNRICYRMRGVARWPSHPATRISIHMMLWGIMRDHSTSDMFRFNMFQPFCWRKECFFEPGIFYRTYSIHGARVVEFKSLGMGKHSRRFFCRFFRGNMGQHFPCWLPVATFDFWCPCCLTFPPSHSCR